jgi:hypothetical protein
VKVRVGFSRKNSGGGGASVRATHPSKTAKVGQPQLGRVLEDSYKGGPAPVLSQPDISFANDRTGWKALTYTIHNVMIYAPSKPELMRWSNYAYSFREFLHFSSLEFQRTFFPA